jgi:UDP-N-acetylglucosamine 2-epimerase (non-hydrolysing)
MKVFLKIIFFVKGNTVIDALHIIITKIKDNKKMKIELNSIFKELGYDIN